jgi:hypothetical protein
MLSIDPLYLKPAMPLGRYCSTVNSLLTMVALVTMVHKQSKPIAEQGSLHSFEPQ